MLNRNIKNVVSTLKNDKELQKKVGAGIVGTSIGAAIGGPVGGVIGAIITPITEDVLTRILSVKEKDRIEKVKGYAISEITRSLQSGSIPKNDFDTKSAAELFEGVLLKAKSTYEEKKLPYIANLFACAPFTSTPIENINQSLIIAEQLSYRQLCILSVIDKTQFYNLGLSDKPLREEVLKINNEVFSGVYQDIVGLQLHGLIGQCKKSGLVTLDSYVGFVVPSELFLYHPGRLLCNGMKLSAIPESDTEKLIEILQPLK